MNSKFVVFVIDDEPIYLQMIEDELSEDDRFDVKAFLSGEECLENLSLKPDIIILDYYLNKNSPDAKNGMEILDELEKRIPWVKVIILSGQPASDVIFNFLMKKNVEKYIVKDDFAFDELKSAINEILLDLKL